MCVSSDEEDHRDLKVRRLCRPVEVSGYKILGWLVDSRGIFGKSKRQKQRCKL